MIRAAFVLKIAGRAVNGNRRRVTYRNSEKRAAQDNLSGLKRPAGHVRLPPTRPPMSRSRLNWLTSFGTLSSPMMNMIT